MASLLVLCLAALLVETAPTEPQEVPPVDVIVVSGPLDPALVGFVEDAIRDSAEDGSQVAIVQLDSPGALTSDVVDLIELFGDPPLPLVVWVGGAPAVAYGGAARLLGAAPIHTAAPGVEIGYFAPTVAGSADSLEVVPAPSPDLLSGTIVVDGPIPGLVQESLPSIGQVVVWLDGQDADARTGPVVLRTALEEQAADGSARLLPLAEVRFREPGPLTRLLRLAVRPEAAFFFFIVVGFALAAFEFYAIGPGLVAAVGVLSLLLGAYGLAVLPVRWWALALLAAALAVYTSEFQRRSFGPLSILATGALVTAGLFITDSAPQVVPSWWGVILTVLLALFFFVIAMPVVARSRLATGTVGRGHLVGRSGRSVTVLSPEGVVEIDGARWRARAHREAGIKKGDQVTVRAVRGLVVEVDPYDPG